jgi:hypothetical protein
MRWTNSARRAVGALVAVATGGALAVVALAGPASAADPCATGGNPIVCENSKPGTDPSEWDISGAGDSDIQGFATDISVNVGGSIGFKVDTDARAYSIEIYRTGWYGGLGARLITTLSPSVPLPQSQPQCLTDATTEIYDCGNWAVSATWNVPTTAVSGVYVADLYRPDNRHASQILFVVRNDASHSQVLVKTSDTTWQAYNSYGGSDFYQGAANGRAYKISYNRPLVTRDGGTNHDNYFSAEYPMVRFLERNGYDVSYSSSVDADRYGSLLKNHSTVLSVGHDEYWSGAERANFEAARDAGVNLAFFSGNEVYWRTRWEPAEAGAATPYRTEVSYKETWSNEKIDPATEWTGTWRDPRFASQADGGGLPENALSGTFFMSNVTDLPVTVTQAQGKLRLWRNTGLSSMTGATTALAPHTVGYESDEDVDNGFRPAGLIDMSTVSGTVSAYMLDFGNLTGAATTTHHITLYRAASGALVFSAGSIQWSWGLDAEHDGDGAPADARMQQATVNLLADMGAQPSSLMSGLVAATPSTDHTGPTVTVASPAQGATIGNGTTVTATGTATDAGGGVVAGVEVSTDGGTTWHPASGTTSWSYSYVQPGNGAVALQVRATDDSGNIGAVASRSVTATCPCSVYGSTTPVVASADDPSPVELGLRFSPTQSGYVTGVRFYKGAANTGTHTGTLWSASGSVLASVRFTGETASGWQTASFSLPVAVSAGTTYVVSYTAPDGGYAVQDEAFAYGGRSQAPLVVTGGYGGPAGGVYADPGEFPTSSFHDAQYYVDAVFTTTDTTPQTAAMSSPTPGASSVSTASVVKVAFSKPASGASVSLATQAGAAVAGSSAYDAASNTVTFTPAAALANGTTYVATASAPGLTGTQSWTFVTAAPNQSAGGTTVSLYDDSATPATLEDSDTVPVTLGVRFTSTSPGTITGVRFYKALGNTGTHVGALWAAGGTTPLAQATFTGESTTGWQTVTFASPVHISANTSYVASYSTTVGRYSSTPDVFGGVGLQRAPLSADSGMYSYSGGYPSATSTASYLVDVVFVQDAVALAVTAQSPAPSSPGAPVSAPVSITVSSPLVPTARLTLKSGASTVAGTSTLSSDARTLTFTPSAALAAATTYTATATGLASTTGSTLADQTWTFTTATADGCPCTMFGSQTPQTAADTDTAAVELGVAFTPTQSGVVSGVRFYKGSGNGGAHTGTLWSSTGTQLATVAFSGESATGWQTATFASPYEVTAGTTYVVSYYAPQGHYAATANAFTADRTVGPLTIPAVGNGRYRYGGGFPTSTWQQTNYFVDVLFSPQALSPVKVSTVSPAAGATGVSRTAAVTATLSRAPDSGTPTLALTGPSGAIAGTSTYDASSLRVTFTPGATMPGNATINAVVTLAGSTPANGSWSFTTTAATSAVSLWSVGVTPSVASFDDPDAVQVGTRFKATVAGAITAIRFYKGAANTGTHTVYLWDSSGNKLASAASSGESASGWQTVALATPVTLTVGATYTASYYTTSGGYAVTSGLLGSTVTNGPLSTVTPGGAYVYGTTAPTGTSTAWYGVDVLFTPSG